MRRIFLVQLIFVLVGFILIGCQPQNSDSESSPAIKALTSYLNALVDKDEAKLTLLSCAEWEASALLELDSFQSVETSLKDLSCRETAIDANSAAVNCQGFIVTSYGSETQEYDLGQRTYQMVEQGDEWLVCGY